MALSQVNILALDEQFYLENSQEAKLERLRSLLKETLPLNHSVKFNGKILKNLMANLTQAPSIQ